MCSYDWSSVRRESLCSRDTIEPNFKDGPKSILSLYVSEPYKDRGEGTERSISVSFHIEGDPQMSKKIRW